MTTAVAPHIVKDGWGGAIVTGGPAISGGIYTQRLNSNGDVNAAWPAGGALQTLTSRKNAQTMADPKGGVFVVWQDYRNDPSGLIADIYIQRIDANGSIHAGWPATGLAVCTAANDQSSPQLVTDGGDGAIVVWQDKRSGTSYDIYAQYIDGDNGIVKWAINGVPVSTGTVDKRAPQLVGDGLGGAIIAWQDYGKDTVNTPPTADIYAQRIDSKGAKLWAADVTVSQAANVNTLNPSDQVNPQLISDGANGAIIAWEDYRNDPLGCNSQASYCDSANPYIPTIGIANIYAQRVDLTGNASGNLPTPAGNWVVDGIQVAYTSGNQQTPLLVTDGAGGAIIVWQDDQGTGGSANVIYSQWLAADGSFPAGATANQVATDSSGDQRNPQLISQLISSPAHYGAWVVWEDTRNDLSSPTPTSDIYAQLIDANLPTLTPSFGDDTAVSLASASQLYPQLVSDDAGGAIITWLDQRYTGHKGIYAQRIDATGALSTFTTPSFNVFYTAGAGGSISGIASQTIVSNGSATTVTAVPNTGYSFVSWSDGVKTAARTDTPVTANISVTANFAINTTFTVSFNSNGGSAVSSQNVKNNATATAPAAPTKTGYTFAGWYSDAGLNSAFAFTTPITANTTLYAKWTATANTSLSVTITGNGSVHGTSTLGQNYSCIAPTCTPASYVYGDQVTLAATPSADYLFSVWGGDCPATSAPCVLSMTANRNVTATFNFVQPLQLIYNSVTTDYSTLADAYAAVANNTSATILGRLYTLTGGLVLNRPVTLIFKGGYDVNFSNNSAGYTTLQGGLTVGSGALTVERLVLQ
jgi:uncharacterized repeat protein (TIGR02543 family)